jgi:hypothetical protein
MCLLLPCALLLSIDIDILSLIGLYVRKSKSNAALYTVHRLDALEREQEEYVERLRTQVLPTPPEPIGIAGRTDDGKDNAPEPPLVDLTALPATPLFWDKHRETVNRLRDAREGRDTYRLPPVNTGRVSTGTRMSTGTGRMSLDSMESATSSFSLDSPTSRTG